MENKIKAVSKKELKLINSRLSSSLDFFKSENEKLRDQSDFLSDELKFFIDVVLYPLLHSFNVSLENKKDLLLYIMRNFCVNSRDKLKKTIDKVVGDKYSLRSNFVYHLIETIESDERFYRSHLEEACLEKDKDEKQILLREINTYYSQLTDKGKSSFNEYLFFTYKTDVLTLLTFTDLLSVKEKYFSVERIFKK